MVWVLARVYVRDQADLTAARELQQRLDLRPSSRAGDASYHAANPHAPAPNARRPVMQELLRDLGPEAFFERFTSLTLANPPSPDDAPFVRDILAPLHVAPGKPVSWAQLPPQSRRALADGLARVLQALDNRSQVERQRALTPTGWAGMAGKIVQGVYGVDYLARAAVAAIGLGANLRADAIYL